MIANLSKINLSAILMVVVVLAATTSHYVAAWGCYDKQIHDEIIACEPYLVGKTDEPPTETCCEQVRGLSQKASITEGHNQFAYCIAIRDCCFNFGFRKDRSDQLPKLCGYTPSIPITPGLDCAK
uniref:Bifunctional inhibitor/plant lipid transfer protein/seed storage helical domain-containing protein n=1 Tax=Kalanchoe fedtschenkoi TaxID=63787 RepID=A0A7N0RDH6_KALFE